MVEGKVVMSFRLVVMFATLRVEEFVENRKLCLIFLVLF